jgi:hypothetical protein
VPIWLWDSATQSKKKKEKYLQGAHVVHDIKNTPVVRRSNGQNKNSPGEPH